MTHEASLCFVFLTNFKFSLKESLCWATASSHTLILLFYFILFVVIELVNCAINIIRQRELKINLECVRNITLNSIMCCIMHLPLFCHTALSFSHHVFYSTLTLTFMAKKEEKKTKFAQFPTPLVKRTQNLKVHSLCPNNVNKIIVISNHILWYLISLIIYFCYVSDVIHKNYTQTQK